MPACLDASMRERDRPLELYLPCMLSKIVSIFSFTETGSSVSFCSAIQCSNSFVFQNITSFILLCMSSLISNGVMVSSFNSTADFTLLFIRRQRNRKNQFSCCTFKINSVTIAINVIWSLLKNFKSSIFDVFQKRAYKLTVG